MRLSVAFMDRPMAGKINSHMALVLFIYVYIYVRM